MSIPHRKANRERRQASRRLRVAGCRARVGLQLSRQRRALPATQGCPAMRSSFMRSALLGLPLGVLASSVALAQGGPAADNPDVIDGQVTSLGAVRVTADMPTVAAPGFPASLVTVPVEQVEVTTNA